MKKVLAYSLLLSLMLLFPNPDANAFTDQKDKTPTSVRCPEGGSRVNCTVKKIGVWCTPRDCSGGDEL